MANTKRKQPQATIKASAQQRAAVLDQICVVRSLIETDQLTVDAIAARLSLVREKLEQLSAELADPHKRLAQKSKR